MNSAYTHAIESSFQFLSRSTKLTAWKHFKELQRNEWLSYTDLCKLRWIKIKALLDYAYDYIPFYRSLWKSHCVNPKKFTKIDDIKNLPFCTKEELIQANLEDQFLLRKRSDFQMVHTSGTTGPHFYIPFSLDDFQVKYACYLRQYYATGWRLGMKSAVLHHFGHPQFGGKYSGREDKDAFIGIRKIAFALAHRRIVLKPYHESFSGNDSFAAEWYQKLRQYQPYLLETFDFNLAVLRDYIRKNNLPPLSIPKIILLGTISEKYRKSLQQEFKSEIYNRYGPHEMEGVAYSCDLHRGMHMAIDCVHTEFVDNSGNSVRPGETGHIVLTDLDSRLMPLIRYKIGDHGFYYQKHCNCGRGFPLMGDIDGRTRDVFELKKTYKIAPAKIGAIFQDESAIRLFQVTQDASNTIVVNIIPDQRTYTEDVSNRLLFNLYKLLGNQEQIVIRIVERVKLEANGRFSNIKKVDPEI